MRRLGGLPPGRLIILAPPSLRSGATLSAVLDLLAEFRGILTASTQRASSMRSAEGCPWRSMGPRATVDVDLLIPIERAKDCVRGRGYSIETGPMILRRDVVKLHQLSKPDPETGDLLSVDLLLVTPGLAEVWNP